MLVRIQEGRTREGSKWACCGKCSLSIVLLDSIEKSISLTMVSVKSSVV